MFFGSWGEICTDPETHYFTNGRISYTNTDRRPMKFLLNFRIDSDARKANTHGFYMSAITYPSESRPVRPKPECGTLPKRRRSLSATTNQPSVNGLVHNAL